MTENGGRGSEAMGLMDLRWEGRAPYRGLLQSVVEGLTGRDLDCSFQVALLTAIGLVRLSP